MSDEIRRVASLPRRRWTEDQKAQLAEWLTPQLLGPAGLEIWNRAAKLPDGARAEMLRKAKLLLKPVQAVALYEFPQTRGGFLGAAVGAGKTLVSFLLPTATNAQRPLLIVPAGSAYDKTLEDFAELSKWWKHPPGWPILPRVETYHTLSRLEYKSLIPNFRPDLIMADEDDLFKNTDASCTLSVARWMAQEPSTMYVGMTGTMVRLAMREYCHRLLWALKYGAPVPTTWVETQYWSEALDERLGRSGIRRRPGALLSFGGHDPNTLGELKAARYGYRDRLADTPGIVLTSEQSCEAPLTLRVLRAWDDPVLDELFVQFRKTRATPEGWRMSDPLSWLRHGGQLGCGFSYYQDPRPPVPWIEARRDFACFVDERITRSQGSGKPLDSERAVALAFKDHSVVRAWRDVKPTYNPEQHKKVAWYSLTPLMYAIEWLKLNSPAIVWVTHVEVGEQLARMTGLPYYGEDGIDKMTGLSVVKADPRRSAILSVEANKRALNMQAWKKALFIGPPQAATRWEQAIGRKHRQGQDHEVTIDVLVSCAEHLRALEKAVGEAEFVRELTPHTQKLLMAQFQWGFDPNWYLQLPTDDIRRARWTSPFST